MDYIEAKKAVALNYNLMAGEIGFDMEDFSRAMKPFFREHPELNGDIQLLAIAEEFTKLCLALKALDKVSASVLKRLKL